MAKGKIIQDEENSFLNRREVKEIIESDKNPTYAEAVEKIAEDFKAKKENISIKLVKGKFGRKTFLISANIYKTLEDKDKIEPKYRKESNKKAEPKKEQAEEQKQKGTPEQQGEDKAEEKKQDKSEKQEQDNKGEKQTQQEDKGKAASDQDNK